MVDRLAYDWGFGAFSRGKRALLGSGVVCAEAVTLVKPTTYMNRSGGALLSVLEGDIDFDPSVDLLVIVDDVALDVGRVRLRGAGSSGGHKGLASIASALGTEEFARLRIGVGRPPSGADLSDWVLSRMPPADEDVILTLLPTLRPGIEAWVERGADGAKGLISK
jgi:PTH1 family peptidyl-tRNA hydrolase